MGNSHLNHSWPLIQNTYTSNSGVGFNSGNSGFTLGSTSNSNSAPAWSGSAWISSDADAFQKKYNDKYGEDFWLAAFLSASQENPNFHLMLSRWAPLSETTGGQGLITAQKAGMGLRKLSLTQAGTLLLEQTKKSIATDIVPACDLETLLGLLAGETFYVGNLADPVDITSTMKNAWRFLGVLNQDHQITPTGVAMIRTNLVDLVERADSDKKKEIVYSYIAPSDWAALLVKLSTPDRAVWAAYAAKRLGIDRSK